MQITADAILAQTLTLLDKRQALVLPPPGQKITAEVKAAPVNGSVALSIGGTRVEAQTSLPLRTGQVLQLRVEQGTPNVVLKVVPQPPQADPVRQAVLSALPKQLPLTEIVANLKFVASGPSAGNRGPTAALPENVQQAARQLLSNLPQTSTLTTADAVKQTLLKAGPFLERSVVEGGAASTRLPAGDLKAGLLNLRAVLTQALSRLPAVVERPALGAQAATSAPPSTPPLVAADNPVPRPPPAALPGGTPQPQVAQQPTLATMATPAEAMTELLRQTDGAVARIELQQMASVMDNDQNRAAWSIELPVRNDDEVDVLQLLIERRQPKAGHGEPGGTTVAIALNLDGLGEIYAHLGWSADKLKVTFWAEREDTVRRLRENLGALTERLTDLGLCPEPIRCHSGAPRAGSPPPRLQKLLDLMV